MRFLDKTASRYRYDIEINTKKTKLVRNSEEPIRTSISSQQLKTVQMSWCNYWPRWIQANSCDSMVETDLKKQNKLRLLHALVLSALLYACKSWTLTAEIQMWIQAEEVRYFRCLLGIFYTNHVTNEELHRR